MVQKRQKIRTREADFQKEEGLFSGKLICADCRKPMARHYSGGKFSGFVCRTYKRQGKSFCDSHKISGEALERTVSLCIQEEVQSRLTDACRAELLFWRQSGTDLTERHTEQMLQHRIQSIMRYKQGCLEKYLDGLITDEDFRVYTADYEEQLKDLQHQKERISRMQDKADAYGAAEAGELLEEIEEGRLSRTLVNGLIDQIEISADGAAVIFFRFREDAGEKVFPQKKRSMCGDGGTYSGERGRVCEPDE